MVCFTKKRLTKKQAQFRQGSSRNRVVKILSDSEGGERNMDEFHIFDFERIRSQRCGYCRTLQ